MAQQPMAGQPPFPQHSYQPAPQQSWQQQPYQPQPWQPPVAQTPDGTDRTMAMFAHLSSPIAWALSAGWLNFLGPLVIWLLYKDRSPFVRNAAAGAFNFTITMWLVSIIGWIMIVTVILLPIGLLLVAIGGLGALVLGIVGAVKTSNGEVYNYPWQIRLLN